MRGPADTLRIDRSLIERTREYLRKLPEPEATATPESAARRDLVGELGHALSVTNADYCPGCARRGTQIEALKQELDSALRRAA